jgi:uncharacterized sulfatase
MKNKGSKNVIMVVLDTHRYDRLGAYGYDRPTTPNLDDFAAESLFFEQAIAPGQWTIPSHASLFSGEAPAVHGTVQADDVLPKEFETLASRLSSSGVKTTGFCNNPLVGVIQNGFKRGFDEFYNYCGVVPSTPPQEKDDLFKPMRKLWSKYTRILRKLSNPIQNTFASPNEFFLAALRPFFVPMWTKAGNFKGNTPRSIKETSAFLEQIERNGNESNFVFLNLMETHLPYHPPEAFIRKFVPYYYDTPEAQHFMTDFNRNAAQWLIPLIAPFSKLEASTLSGIYDAEVAYQDHLLAELIAALDTPYHRDNSLMIFLADHGEMLGEHGLMGHGFGVYEELIRVPLFMRVPGLSDKTHIKHRVSITQLFHTVLDYYGMESVSMPYADDVDVGCMSLLQMPNRESCPTKKFIAEAYSPENALEIMRHRAPGLIEKSHADKTRRAVYHGSQKMIAIDGLSNVLYDLDDDPEEEAPFLKENKIAELSHVIDEYLNLAASRRGLISKRKVSLSDDLIQQRLRDLGYLE